MRTYVAVPGTHGWRSRNDPDAWMQPGSAFAAFMQSQGYRPFRSRPFWWTTDVAGLFAWRRWLAWILPKSVEIDDRRAWEVGGYNLCDHADGATAIIAHSHGGNVAAHALAMGLKVDLLVTVSTPVRRDLDAVYKAARERVTHWRHLYASDGDAIQWWGSFGDGDLVPSRMMPYAHENFGVSKARHTRLLTDPAFHDDWVREGWLTIGYGRTRAF